MSAISIIINILALIALIIILSYLIYYIYKYWKNMKNRHIASLMNPPGPYMQNSGAKCPDYWINTGIDSNGNYICKNSFNIQTNNPTNGSCANKCNSDQATFSSIPNGFTWEFNNPNGLTSYNNNWDIIDTEKPISKPNKNIPSHIIKISETGKLDREDYLNGKVTDPDIIRSTKNIMLFKKDPISMRKLLRKKKTTTKPKRKICRCKK